VKEGLESVNYESILSEAHVLVIDYLRNGLIIPRKVEIFRSSIVKFRPLNGHHIFRCHFSHASICYEIDNLLYGMYKFGRKKKCR
jgi:hypothetical protein